MRCEKHKDHRLPAFSCPVCVLDERNRLRTEDEAIWEALSAIVECWDGPDYKHVMRPKIEAARQALAAHDRGEK